MEGKGGDVRLTSLDPIRPSLIARTRNLARAALASTSAVRVTHDDRPAFEIRSVEERDGDEEGVKVAVEYDGFPRSPDDAGQLCVRLGSTKGRERVVGERESTVGGSRS